MKKISIIILIICCVWSECNAQNPEGKINFLIQIDDTVIVLSPEKDHSNSTSQYTVLKDENTNLRVESTVTMINKITHDTITEVYPYLSEQEYWIDKSWMDNRSDTVHSHYNELQTWSGMHIYSLHITHKKATMVVNFDNPGTYSIYVKILFKPGQYSFGLDDLINGNNEVIKNELFD
jgi:hypothetical protein